MWPKQSDTSNMDKLQSSATTSQQHQLNPMANLDVLMLIIRHFRLKDKVACRLVSRSWRDAIDKHFAGQQSLSVQLVNNKKLLYRSSSFKSQEEINNWLQAPKPLAFQQFHLMLTNFGMIQSLTIRDQPLSDQHMLAITSTCHRLVEVNLYSCVTEPDPTKSPFVMTSYGWRLLAIGCPKVKKLTLRNCNINEQDCEFVISRLNKLECLDIADNYQLTGRCLVHLSNRIYFLCVGNLNSDHYLDIIIDSLTESRCQSSLRHLELRGGVNQPYYQIKKLSGLESLSLKFFCPQDHVTDTLSPIGKLQGLKSLVLHQERCYDEPSAIDEVSFSSIVRGCPILERLSITGEYGWRLRLADQSIGQLVASCRRLKSFSLTGNSPLITDSSVEQLVSSPRLRSLSLTSFERITDRGLIHLITRHHSLDYIGIKETSTISEATLNACIRLAETNPSRRLSVSFAETKIVRPRSMARLPDNLKVVFEDNRRPRRQSDEPSAIKMIAVVGMSAIILAMILITMMVVIVMPVGMLLMMLYDHCIDYAVSVADRPIDRNAAQVAGYYLSEMVNWWPDTGQWWTSLAAVAGGRRLFGWSDDF